MNTAIRNHIVAFKTVVQVKQMSIALVCFWLPVIVFAKLADEIVERKPIGVDSAVLSWLHAQTSPAWNAIFLFFTNAGSAFSVIAIVGVLVMYMVYKRRYRLAAVLLFSVGGAAAANVVLKLIFHRQRPALWPSIVTEHGYSFPSGHAMASSALVFAVIAITWQTRYRWLAIGLGPAFALLVGASRLYFGVHFPTDIVAGWCVGFVWVLLVSSLVQNSPWQLRHWAVRHQNDKPQ